MVRWLRWHCPPDTGFEIRALAVWGRARYLSVTEAPHNTNFHTWMGKKQFCFFQTAETGNRTPDSGVKGSGANHYPRAPAHGPVNMSRLATYTYHTAWLVGTLFPRVFPYISVDVNWFMHKCADMAMFVTSLTRRYHPTQILTLPWLGSYQPWKL